MSDVVEERVTAGRRVAELLASEIEGRPDGRFASLSVTNAEQSVEPTAVGSRAYDIASTGRLLGRVYIQPNRARLEISAGHEPAREEVEFLNLRWRTTGGPAPKLLVFLSDGVAVKRVLPVIGAAAEAMTEE